MTSDHTCDVEDRIKVPPLANGDVKMHIVNHADKKQNNNANGDSACGDKLKAGSSGDEEDLKISREFFHIILLRFKSLISLTL